MPCVERASDGEESRATAACDPAAAEQRKERRRSSAAQAGLVTPPATPHMAKRHCSGIGEPMATEGAGDGPRDAAEDDEDDGDAHPHMQRRDSGVQRASLLTCQTKSRPKGPANRRKPLRRSQGRLSAVSVGE